MVPVRHLTLADQIREAEANRGVDDRDRGSLSTNKER